jgi:hypothetical protein
MIMLNSLGDFRMRGSFGAYFTFVRENSESKAARITSIHGSHNRTHAFKRSTGEKEITIP